MLRLEVTPWSISPGGEFAHRFASCRFWCSMFTVRLSWCLMIHLKGAWWWTLWTFAHIYGPYTCHIYPWHLLSLVFDWEHYTVVQVICYFHACFCVFLPVKSNKWFAVCLLETNGYSTNRSGRTSGNFKGTTVLQKCRGESDCSSEQLAKSLFDQWFHQFGLIRAPVPRQRFLNYLPLSLLIMII